MHYNEQNKARHYAWNNIRTKSYQPKKIEKLKRNALLSLILAIIVVAIIVSI